MEYFGDVNKFKFNFIPFGKVKDCDFCKNGNIIQRHNSTKFVYCPKCNRRLR